MNKLFVEATASQPFANGTEGTAWMGVWCQHCVHDHAMHDDTASGPGCALIARSMFARGDDWVWPEAWTPEPPGSFALPPRLVCGQFSPCTSGSCQGDPHVDLRSRIVAEVHAEWKAVS